MSRWQRKYNERLSNYYGKRDESGNGECFADSYQRTMGMTEDRRPARVATPAPAPTPLQQGIAMCEAEIAKYEAKSYLLPCDKEQLAFYRSLLAKKLAEQAATEA